MDRPQASWNGDEWTCFVELSAWRDLLRDEPVGQVSVVFLSEEDPDAEPSDEQIHALQRLRETDDQLRKIVERAIRGYYDEMRERYLDALGELGAAMPHPLTAREFDRLHTLQILYVHSAETPLEPAIGFSFHALWEIEHGLGVLVRGRKVLAVGAADVAFGA
jgi:hypothetical protein